MIKDLPIYLTWTGTAPLLLYHVTNSVKSGFNTCLVIVFQVAQSLLCRKKMNSSVNPQLFSNGSLVF